ncbi:Family of unknown function DUF5662 like protein [Aduncisulcus paluster]|uniref:Uncharacterized protein n=1 Tax=Aduncisulcus paluster TaxID=2918883 RepID=A0ABQ5KRU5_9EUKA|nr:Family of unknown function DUF5662 like protein [Aduncisulcus paluster]
MTPKISSSPLFDSLLTIEDGKYAPVHKIFDEVFTGLTLLDCKKRMSVHEARVKVQCIKLFLPTIGEDYDCPSIEAIIREQRKKYGGSVGTIEGMRCGVAGVEHEEGWDQIIVLIDIKNPLNPYILPFKIENSDSPHFSSCGRFFDYNLDGYREIRSISSILQDRGLLLCSICHQCNGDPSESIQHYLPPPVEYFPQCGIFSFQLTVRAPAEFRVYNCSTSTYIGLFKNMFQASEEWDFPIDVQFCKVFTIRNEIYCLEDSNADLDESTYSLSCRDRRDDDYYETSKSSSESTSDGCDHRYKLYQICIRGRDPQFSFIINISDRLKEVQALSSLAEVKKFLDSSHEVVGSRLIMAEIKKKCLELTTVSPLKGILLSSNHQQSPCPQTKPGKKRFSIDGRSKESLIRFSSDDLSCDDDIHLKEKANHLCDGKVSVFVPFINSLMEEISIFDYSQDMEEYFITRTKKHIERVIDNCKRIISCFSLDTAVKRKESDKEFENDEDQSSSSPINISPDQFPILMAQIEHHDQSKFEDEERIPYIWLTHFYRMRENFGCQDYEYPNKFIKDIVGRAIKHHLASNTHHVEKYDGRFTNMTDYDIIEMVCDWQAIDQEKGKGSCRKYAENVLERGDKDHPGIDKRTKEKIYYLIGLF